MAGHGLTLGGGTCLAVGFLLEASRWDSNSGSSSGLHVGCLLEEKLLAFRCRANSLWGHGPFQNLSKLRICTLEQNALNKSSHWMQNPTCHHWMQVLTPAMSFHVAPNENCKQLLAASQRWSILPRSFLNLVRLLRTTAHGPKYFLLASNFIKSDPSRYNKGSRSRKRGKG